MALQRADMILEVLYSSGGADRCHQVDRIAWS